MSKTVTPYGHVQSGKKEQVAHMFDSISPKYDFLNHFLSFGIDFFWRRKAIRFLRDARPDTMLDVATGTGDFAFEAIRRLNPKRVTGVDISEGMLSVARRKIQQRQLTEQFDVRLGDSEQLPFDDNSFDAVTVAFGVRNFENLEKGLASMCRVLRPGGRVIILEFSNPRTFPVKQLYQLYSNTLMPFFGRLFSKDARAYSYLPESIAAFPDGNAFTALMRNAGFGKAKAYPQTFGICTIYVGEK